MNTTVVEGAASNYQDRQSEWEEKSKKKQQK